MSRDRHLDEALAAGEVARRLRQARTATAAPSSGLHAAEIRDGVVRARREARPPAKWDYWAHVPKAELWQCVALSLGIEPVDDMRATRAKQPIIREVRARPWFDGHEREDLRLRLRIALANAGFDRTSPLRPVGPVQPDMECNLFSLAEFGAWARECWPDEVAEKYPSPSTVESVAAKHQQGDDAEAQDSASSVSARACVLPRGVSTDAIATAFDGCHFSADKWRQNLEVSKARLSPWLSLALLADGRRGTGGWPRLWNPVMLGIGLLHHSRWTSSSAGKLTKLTQAFGRNELVSWRDAWDAEMCKLDGFQGGD